MMFAVSELDLGTSEADWLASPRITQAPVITWGPPGRVLVVAPHPDDEVLGVGGSIACLSRSGHSIAIASVTDGEASHPSSPTVTRAVMTERRTSERRDALLRLGVGNAGVSRLRYPDGEVTRSISELADRLIALLSGVSLCLAPFERDGHPDHDASGRAASIACAATRARLLRYPVWAWHWARPEGEDFPWDRLRRVPLAPEVLAAKRAAICLYRSQILPLSARHGDEAILPPPVVRRFERPFEVLFE
ncbi:PIG-L family deacetylase [soil metagenome]